MQPSRPALTDVAERHAPVWFRITYASSAIGSVSNTHPLPVSKQALRHPHDLMRLRRDRRVSKPQPLGARRQQRITSQDHPPIYPHRCDALRSHCRSASVHDLASLEPSSFLRCRSATRAWCRPGSPGAIFDHGTCPFSLSVGPAAAGHRKGDGSRSGRCSRSARATR